MNVTDTFPLSEVMDRKLDPDMSNNLNRKHNTNLCYTLYNNFTKNCCNMYLFQDLFEISAFSCCIEILSMCK